VQQWKPACGSALFFATDAMYSNGWLLNLRTSRTLVLAASRELLHADLAYAATAEQKRYVC
jgi:hypothetical protein